jgi:hypothetical protein
MVHNGIVHLWGTLLDERQRGAISVAKPNYAIWVKSPGERTGQRSGATARSWRE